MKFLCSLTNNYLNTNDDSGNDEVVFFFFLIRLRNGVKFCKVMHLPEVSQILYEFLRMLVNPNKYGFNIGLIIGA